MTSSDQIVRGTIFPGTERHKLLQRHMSLAAFMALTALLVAWCTGKVHIIALLVVCNVALWWVLDFIFVCNYRRVLVSVGNDRLAITGGRWLPRGKSFPDAISFCDIASCNVLPLAGNKGECCLSIRLNDGRVYYLRSEQATGKKAVMVSIQLEEAVLQAVQLHKGLQ